MKIDQDPPVNADKVRYVFDVLLTSTRFPIRITTDEGEADITISYGDDQGGERGIHIFPSDFFGSSYLKPESMPVPPFPILEYPGIGDLPAIYFRRNTPPGEQLIAGNDGVYVHSDGERIATNLDIIASSFFLLSRYEEIMIKGRDDHSRFPPSLGVLYEQDLYRTPIVNRYADALMEWILKIAGEREEIELYPEGKRLASCLTHDVDFVSARNIVGSWGMENFGKELREMLMKVIKGGPDGIREVIARVRPILEKNDPYWTFDSLLEDERGGNIRSAFYFMTGDRTGPYCQDYDLGESRIRDLIDLMEKSGCEIGLHGSYTSFTDADMLRREKEALEISLGGNTVDGVRQHYLRFEAPLTWRVQESAGLKYSTTLGFSGHNGFRSGYCMPYRPFDLLEDRRMDIWEIPVISMDKSLGEDPQKAFTELSSLFEEVRKHGGVMVLIWHNSFLADARDPSWVEYYRKMLDLISGEDVYSCTPKQVVDIWERRASQT